MANLTAISAFNSSIYIDWTAPFTLDITSPANTITYCVDIYNISNQEVLLSVCDIIESHYTYSYYGQDPSPCDSLDIYVIPINSAGNGSSSQAITGFYESMLHLPKCLSFPLVMINRAWRICHLKFGCKNF